MSRFETLTLTLFAVMAIQDNLAEAGGLAQLSFLALWAWQVVELIREGRR